MRRFAWTFFFLNVAGFLTYHLYPAAPPWESSSKSAGEFPALSVFPPLFLKVSTGRRIAQQLARCSAPLGETEK